MVKDNKLLVSEIFSSIDGEGFHAGRVTVFVRLFGCNLRCPWCDTKTTWTLELHRKTYHRDPLWMSVDEIVEKVEEMEKNFYYKSICLTGGEPLMEENKEIVMNLIKELCYRDYAVNIETNGAIDYKDYVDLRNRSVKISTMIFDNYGNRQGMSLITDWKLPSSKMNEKMIESNLQILGPQDLIKCVITDDERDWEEVERLCKSGTKAKIYLSPCFGQVTMSKIPEFIISHPQYNLTSQLQLHKLFWSPDKVGV